MNLYGEESLKQISKTILDFSKADQTEVVISSYDQSLTRFANSYIHQNVSCFSTQVQIRVVVGKKISVVSTNLLDSSSLKEAVTKAIFLTTFTSSDEDFITLPKPSKIHKVHSFSKNTVQLGSIDRARAVQIIIEKAKKAKLTAFGAYEIVISELAVANSFGVWAYQPTTMSNLSTTVSGTTSTGFASMIHFDASTMDPERVARIAIQKALLSDNPKDIPGGDYEVILEAPAVSEMMDYFSYLGSNGLCYLEKTSCLTNKLGKRLFSPKLTVIDDPFDEKGIPQAFDYEGYSKEKTTIIDRGIAKNVVYDSYLSNKFHQKNTGNALPAPNTDGPIAGNFSILPGKYSTEQLIKKVKRGILVTRFWYVRMLHPTLLNITGMTRDGTFLIEDGKIVCGLKNLRFTQSIPYALSHIKNISNDVSPSLMMTGVGSFPSLQITGFHFND